MLSQKLQHVDCFKIPTHKSNQSRIQTKFQSGNNVGSMSRRAILPATLVTAHELLKANQANAKTANKSSGDWSSPGLAAPDNDTPQ